MGTCCFGAGVRMDEKAQRGIHSECLESGGSCDLSADALIGYLLLQTVCVNHTERKMRRFSSNLN